MGNWDRKEMASRAYGDENAKIQLLIVEGQEGSYDKLFFFKGRLLQMIVPYRYERRD